MSTKLITKCAECGEDTTDNCGRWCFSCWFWLGQIKQQDPSCVREKGRHYRIASEGMSIGNDKGFGGQKFTVTFNDGRVVKTDNLWCQGNIPERFRARLPDNATIEGA